MKIEKVIKKNIKLLLRSRVSSLILVLGPLLVILLIGVSFSTNSFSLNIGAYSGSYSDLSNSLIKNLEDEDYSVKRFDSEELCISSVKDQDSHACIIFPADLTVENDKSNVVEFYVDQSKINLVYLVMSTLTGSIGEASEEISKELTSQIVSALLATKDDIAAVNILADDLVTRNNLVVQDAFSSKSDLSTNPVNAISLLGTVDELLDNLVTETELLVEEGLSAVDNANISNSEAAPIESAFEDLDGIVAKAEQNVFFQTGEISKKINAVVINLNTLSSNAQISQEKAQDIKDRLSDVISRINSIEVTNAENIASPISTKITPVVQSESNLGFLFPSLVVMLIMFIGLLLPSMLIIMEKNSRAFFRLFTTPTKPWLFVGAFYLTSMLLLSMQLVIILSVSQFYFDINFLDSLGLILLSLLIIMSLFILIGMFIGYLLNTEEMAMLVSVSVATLFLLTSGIIFPIESMPDYLIGIVKLNPVILSSDIFRESLLFNSGFGSISESILYLLLFCGIMIVSIYVIKHLERSNLGSRKLRRNILVNHFDFGKGKAKTLPEFIVSIQNLTDEKFLELLEEEAYGKWVFYVLRNRDLAMKMKGLKKKDEILETLTNYIREKQKNAKPSSGK